MQQVSSVGQNISHLRRSRKMTQVDLARLANINRRYLYDIENDRKSPTIEVAGRLKSALKCGWLAILKGV